MMQQRFVLVLYSRETDMQWEKIGCNLILFHEELIGIFLMQWTSAGTNEPIITQKVIGSHEDDIISLTQ